MNLRPYQSTWLSGIHASMSAGHRRPLGVMPCGGGKTVCFSYLASQVSSRGKRVLLLAHRDELIGQISRTLTAFKVGHSFIAAGRPYSPGVPVQVGSVQTVARRLTKILEPDFLIQDEAHHGLASTFKAVYAAYKKALMVGVTATPCRLSGEPLGDVFDDLVIGPSVNELTDIGALCPFTIYCPPPIKTSDIPKRGGDYAKDKLEKAANKPTITGDCISHYKRLAFGKQGVVFTCSIQHAKDVAEAFNAEGIRAASIDGKMADTEQKRIMDAFRNKALTILVSVDLISEGVDVPGIECVSILRPTASLALWIQQAGRGLRPAPGKSMAVIIDHTNNSRRFGKPSRQHAWTLTGEMKKPKNADRINYLRTCPHCLAALEPGTEVCLAANPITGIICGYRFPPQYRTVEVVDGELVEYEEMDPEEERRKNWFGSLDRAGLVAFFKAKGNPKPWAAAGMILKRRKQEQEAVA